MSCRIFLDQNVAVAITSALRRAGHDALNVRDVGMLGASDSNLLVFAAREGRVFITSDYADFTRLGAEWNASSRPSPGIVLVKINGPDYAPGSMVARVEKHITGKSELLANTVTWLPHINS